MVQQQLFDAESTPSIQVECLYCDRDWLFLESLAEVPPGWRDVAATGVHPDSLQASHIGACPACIIAGWTHYEN